MSQNECGLSVVVGEKMMCQDVSSRQISVSGVILFDSYVGKFLHLLPLRIQRQRCNPLIQSPEKWPLTSRCMHSQSQESWTDLCEIIGVETESSVIQPAVSIVLVTSNSL